jgi:hypothetical protein
MNDRCITLNIPIHNSCASLVSLRNDSLASYYEILVFYKITKNSDVFRAIFGINGSLIVINVTIIKKLHHVFQGRLF